MSFNSHSHYNSSKRHQVCLCQVPVSKQMQSHVKFCSSVTPLCRYICSPCHTLAPTEKAAQYFTHTLQTLGVVGSPALLCSDSSHSVPCHISRETSNSTPTDTSGQWPLLLVLPVPMCLSFRAVPQPQLTRLGPLTTKQPCTQSQQSILPAQYFALVPQHTRVHRLLLQGSTSTTWLPLREQTSNQKRLNSTSLNNTEILAAYPLDNHCGKIQLVKKQLQAQLQEKSNRASFK